MNDSPENPAPSANPSCVASRESLLSGTSAADRSTPSRERGARLDRARRWLLGGLGLTLAAMLGAALVVQPAGQGYGTHRQLGLPPCMFVALFGLRCPSCGMTTAWAHLVRGQLAQAAAANTGGALLGLAATLVAPWALLSALRGRVLGGRPGRRPIIIAALVVATVTFAQWLGRLAF
jgi:hypothetical protein